MTFRRSLLATLAILTLSLGTVALTQVPPGPPDFGPAIAAQERHTDELMRIPGVEGTAVGLGNGRPVVQILTRRGEVDGLPNRLDGIPVAVKVVGEIRATKGPPPKEPSQDPTARFDRPVPIGVSTGHPDITAGTICCRVTDGSQVWALSNNHVYANMNLASLGDSVIQPGDFDGGTAPADEIGTLDDFMPIDFSGGDNVIDAAIALSTTELLGNATPPDGYGTPKSATVTPVVGLRVKKYGRTTAETKGRIDGINATVNVNYGAPGVARFVGQIVITPGNFSAGGDSGSLIVVERGRDADSPVGLLFAGSILVTIANPINDVLDAFNVTIDGE